MDNEPVVIFRPSGVKVVLVPGNNPPIIVEPTITTSVTIARSGIRGPKGDKGDQGEQGLPGTVDGELPAFLDGGFA